MEIKAVLFDLDDTLISWDSLMQNWWAVHYRMFRHLYQHLQFEGHSLPEEEIFVTGMVKVIREQWKIGEATWRGQGLEECLMVGFGRFNLDLSRIDSEQCLFALKWGRAPEAKLFPGTIPLLDLLQQDGYKIGLITNSYHPMWMRDIELRHFGIFDYFDARTTSGDAGYIKPHPKIFRLVLDQLEVLPEEALFVGDWPYSDIYGANLVGMKSVLMSPEHLKYELGEYQPDYTIGKLLDLWPILTELNQA